MKTSLNIESCFVQELKNGIYSVLFNTRTKWIEFHAYSDTLYIFGQKDNDSHEDYEGKIHEIPVFLPEGIPYMRTVIQEKDQIIFYFLPFYLLQDKKIIYEYSEPVLQMRPHIPMD